jgi:heme oxygenase
MLLDDLPAQTRSHPSALEQLNSLPSNREDYLALLESFYGYVAPWERQLARVLPPDDPIRRGRDKTEWLEADLAHFGYTAADRRQIPLCASLPATTRRLDILGAAYVLEGSTLGGQIISRHVAEAFDLERGHGDRYFQSYGTHVGPMWQAFRRELLRHSSPENDPLIVAAAQDALAKLAAWFASRKGALA